MDDYSAHEGRTQERPRTIGSAAGHLLGSLFQLGQTVVDYGKSQLLRLGDGLGEEIQRATQIVICSALIVMLAAMGLLLTGLTVVIAFWDSPYRLLSAILVTVNFFLIAGIAWLVLRAKLKNRPSLLRGAAQTALLASIWRQLTR